MLTMAKATMRRLKPKKTWWCLTLLCHSASRDIHRLGVTLMGHQKKIMTSVQLMRVQVLHRSVPSVHV